MCKSGQHDFLQKSLRGMMRINGILPACTLVSTALAENWICFDRLLEKYAQAIFLPTSDSNMRILCSLTRSSVPQKSGKSSMIHTWLRRYQLVWTKSRLRNIVSRLSAAFICCEILRRWINSQQCLIKNLMPTRNHFLNNDIDDFPTDQTDHQFSLICCSEVVHCSLA